MLLRIAPLHPSACVRVGIAASTHEDLDAFFELRPISSPGTEVDFFSPDGGFRRWSLQAAGLFPLTV
ncbi:hypothetical protein [Megalodesulfovibrio paquesii]